ncbi:unnamed protein product [Allacma fusca]|uniref:Uncharacterized protein n=1 Tax=Allacma fusca TaxID=39272 RepID=A0A8J2JXV2_9HEXA|nr:unnamed protein product [Allacma fusca]
MDTEIKQCIAAVEGSATDIASMEGSPMDLSCPVSEPPSEVLSDVTFENGSGEEKIDAVQVWAKDDLVTKMKTPNISISSKPYEPSRPKVWYSRSESNRQVFINVQRETVQGTKMRVNFKVEQTPDVIKSLSYLYSLTIPNLQRMQQTLNTCLDEVNDFAKKRASKTISNE